MSDENSAAKIESRSKLNLSAFRYLIIMSVIYFVLSAMVVIVLLNMPSYQFGLMRFINVSYDETDIPEQPSYRYRGIGILGATLILDDILKGIWVLDENPDTTFTKAHRKKIYAKISDVLEEEKKLNQHRKDMEPLEMELHQIAREIMPLLNEEQLKLLKEKTK